MSEPKKTDVPVMSEERRAERSAQRREHIKKGLVIVNTGNGKGKTTAALGILMRAWGRDMRLGGVQFFKHENASFGELKATERMGIKLTPMGDGFTWTSKDLDETRAKALHGWELAKPQIASGDFDIFLLDEFTYVMSYGWLNPSEVIEWLKEQAADDAPDHHGRHAPEELVAYADLVTEMREIKHPFKEQGIHAQRGIEF